MSVIPSPPRTRTVRVRAATVEVGDVMQHPVFPGRWIHVEWVGKNIPDGEISIAGWFSTASYLNDQRESVRIKLREIVTKCDLPRQRNRARR